MNKAEEKKKPESPKKKTQRKKLTAKEKCQAVLSIWSERRKPAEVSKELGVTWTQLNYWQNRALSAMMTALEPRGKTDEEKGPALGPKLEMLLEKTVQRNRKFSKLEKRLERIQKEAVTASR